MSKLNSSRQNVNTPGLLLRNLICIAAGVFLWLYPDAFANGVVIGVGILLIFYAIVTFLISRFNIVRSIFISASAINGIVSLAVGLAFVLAPSFFAKWFISVLAIIIIGLSVLQLTEIISLRRFNPSASGFLFLSPLLMLAVGIIVLMKPEGIVNLVGYFCAGTLIYTGLSGIFLAIRLKKEGKRFVNSQQRVDATIINPETNDYSHS